MTTLTAQQVDDALKELGGWQLRGGELVRELTFPSFAQAIAFVNSVAQSADRADHHPDIDIRYNRVRLALVTHDAGGITGRDLKLAREISAISG